MSSTTTQLRTAPAARTRRKQAGSEPRTRTATRKLSFGPLTGYVGYALRRAQMAAVARFLEELKEVELRPTQFAVLTLIHENPGLTQTEVCTALGIQKANFVPLLKLLERRGLATRRVGVTDRRSFELHLTPKGEAVQQRACKLHSQLEARVIERLGKRRRDQLLKLLNSYIDS